MARENIKSIISKEDIPQSGYVILYFYSTWMNFQSKMLKMINSLKIPYDTIVLGIDVDQHKDLVKSYRVSEIPTFIIINNGDVIGRFSGFVLTKPFNSFFNKHLKRANEA